MTAKTLIAAAVAAFAAATPAAAEPFAFSYQQFELETRGGRSALMARLDRSIERYCDTDAVRSLFARKAAAECHEELKAEIMDKVDSAEFAALDQ